MKKLQHVVVMTFLCLLCIVPRAQDTGNRVTGTVISEAGAPIEGVSVEVFKTTEKEKAVLSTSSDEKGAFRLSGLATATAYRIVFSSVGFEKYTLSSFTLKSDAANTLLVRMQSASEALNDVVVVGYGQRSRRNLTGAVSSVTQEEFNRGVFSTPAQLLQGKVPGLNIGKSGNPNEKPTVILRGPSTLREGGAQDPFYVIDGVPGASIDLVSPDDIISMDVLKDAASTAIYGSRASNGVIMITTRRAKTGQTTLSYSGYTAFEKISNTIDMLSGDELRAYLAANNKSLNPSDDDGSNTNWQNEVARTGISHNHNLSLGGGTANTVYGASINFLENQGIIRNSGMDRLIIRTNISQKAFDNRLKIDLAASNSITNQQNVPGQLFQNILNFLPTVGVFDTDGNYTEDFLRGSYLNPVSLIDNNVDETKVKTLLLNGKAELKVLPGLRYTLSLSSQDENISRQRYYNRYSGLAQNINGAALRNTLTNTKKILETYLNYDQSWGAHGLQALAGYSWQEDRNNDGFQSTNQGFVTDELFYNNLGLGDPPAGYLPDYGEFGVRTLRLISFYGRLNYQFNNKYLLDVSLRQDGSSAFGQNNRWGMFPAFSAAWRISNEKFMANATMVDDLKLRIGYGVSGNSLGFNPFISTLLYSPVGRFYYNNNYINAIGPVQNNNPDLKWERTSMLNLGVDFSLFNGKLKGALDVYDKVTEDLIWNYSVSTTEYFVGNLTANAGKINNKGIELMVEATPVSQGKFRWNTAINASKNKNKVVSLSNDKFTLDYINTAFVGGKGQSGNWSQIVQEGLPIGSFNTWRYAGKDANGVTQILGKDGKPRLDPNTDDFGFTGNAQPKLLYGWNNTFSYGAWDLNVFVRGVYGNKILNATLASLNSPSDALQYNIPAFTVQEAFTDYNAYLVSDRFIESGSYLRMDNATLGYRFKNVSRAFQTLRVYVSGNNLFTITNYRGIDPEVNIGGLTPGIDNKNYYPKTRSFLLGVNVSF